MEKLDFIIFGATGYTGKCTVKKWLQILPDFSNMTWGIAGRSHDKLRAVLSDLGPETDIDLSKVPIVVADVNDDNSLVNMAKRTKVVANCAGPFRLYGEAVVKACIAGKAHHLDITGETQFMETMQLKYDEEAKNAGVYIISACGFDSIPADLGVVFLEKKFNGIVNAVESYLTFQATGNAPGSFVSMGTLESVMLGVRYAGEMKTLRRKLYPEEVTSQPKLKSRGLIHKPAGESFWSLPFLGADESVVYRTQRFLLANRNKRLIQMRTYFGVPSFFRALGFVFYGLFFVIAASFKLTSKPILKHPKFFTFGRVSHEPPTEEQANNSRFSIILRGTGWDGSTVNVDKAKPNKRVTVKVSGVNPAYGSTCVTLLMSAITVIKEEDKIPGRGGVLTTGAAFYDTSIIEKLNKYKITFELVSEERL